MDTFSPPPLVRDQNPLHPLTDNTHESVAIQRWQNGQLRPARETRTLRISAMQQIDYCRPPPNCLRAAHISIALPTAAAETEQHDDANRSIGRTYCIGTATDGPYMAVGIDACNPIVVANVLCR